MVKKEDKVPNFKATFKQPYLVFFASILRSVKAENTPHRVMTGRVTLTINVLCDHEGPLQPTKKTFRILLFFTTPSECVIGLDGMGLL